MDGGDGHAGTKRRYPLEHLPLANRYGPRRTTRPGTCTLVDDLRRDVRGHGSMWARAARTARPIGLDEGFASALASLRRRQRRAAHRRTPRNARAQCNGRWRCARRFEDALSVELQLSTDRSTLAHSPRCSRRLHLQRFNRNARGERRDQGRARSQDTRPPSSPATMRRSSMNAPQRAGARGLVIRSNSSLANRTGQREP